MKNILLFTLIILILSACSNNEKKAKKLIKDYLKTTMNDYSSYESVEFSSLDSTLLRSFAETDEWTAMNRELGIQIMNSVAYSFSDTAKYAEAKFNSDLIKAEILEAEKNFKPKFNGWQIAHSFRGKNAFGGTMLAMMNFYFNKDLTAITEVVDLKEKLKDLE